MADLKIAAHKYMLIVEHGVPKNISKNGVGI